MNIKQDDKEREERYKKVENVIYKKKETINKYASIQNEKRQRAQQNKSMFEKEIHENLGQGFEKLKSKLDQGDRMYVENIHETQQRVHEENMKH